MTSSKQQSIPGASPGRQPGETTPLDAATLATLREILEGDMASVIETYLEEAPQLLADAKVADAQGDRATLRACLHSLKSSSANVGALGLAERARTLEAVALLADPGVIKLQLKELQAEYARVDIALQNFI